MQKTVDQLNQFSPLAKRLAVISLDTILLLASLWLAYAIRLDTFFIPTPQQILTGLTAPLVAVPVFALSGLYRAVIRYLGEQALWVAAKSVTIATLLWAILIEFTGLHGGIAGISHGTLFVYWALSTVAIVGGRLMIRELFWHPVRNRYKGNNVLVYGAGEAGAQLVQALWHTHDLYPVAFIDNDKHLRNREVLGLKVYPLSQLNRLIEHYGIKEVLLAIPQASRARRSEIIRQLQAYPVHARVLPSVSEIARGKVSVSDLREVEVGDLLGRNEVPPNQSLLTRNITGKTVMVTGAGGSIGSELCRQIARLNPNRLVLLDNSEHALYQIDRKLRSQEPINAQRVEPILGSVLTRSLVEHLLEKYRVDTIYHAAAYKHVPLVETNEIEGVNNNVFGTLVMAEAAIKCGVKTFVLVSSDKAVRPTNIMGASKRLSELVLQALNDSLQPPAPVGGQVRPVFSMVRFGNVLDSSGSVIPLFREQIRAGGPITVTHAQVSRYFMSIPEAAQLVLQAGAMATGGDVFVLDMGEPVRIMDLARQMVELSGLTVLDENNPDGDIRIELTGLRSGEKLHEELLIGNSPTGTEHPKILRAKEKMLPWAELKKLLDEIRTAYETVDVERTRQLVMSHTDGSKPMAPEPDVPPPVVTPPQAPGDQPALH